jgi:hypothetical protein
MVADPRYLTEIQVAEMTGRALSTLRNERFCRRGIPYLKIGRSVRYSLEDVVRYMESHRIETSIE